MAQRSAHPGVRSTRIVLQRFRAKRHCSRPRSGYRVRLDHPDRATVFGVPANGRGNRPREWQHFRRSRKHPSRGQRVQSDRRNARRFHNGSTLIGTSFTNPYGVFLNGVGIGTYVITARATNPYKMTVTSAPISVTVRVNQAPTVALTSPANGSSFTAPASIPLAASASDPDGSIARVEFLSGTTVIATTNVFPYQGSWSNVPAGTYQLAARATDNVGAQSTSSPTRNVVVASPPTVFLNSPPPNQTVAPGTPITVSATPAADQTHGRSVASVLLSARNAAGSVVWTLTTYPCTTACGGPLYTGTWTPTVADNYTITATVTDTGGATADSVPVALRVAIVPTVSLGLIVRAMHPLMTGTAMLRSTVSKRDPRGEPTI